MSIRRRISHFIAAGALVTAPMAWSEGVGPSGASFMHVFAGLCLRHGADLEGLRSELKAKGLPSLEAAAASAFLDGHPGDAWPVPDGGSMGNLILVLPSDRYSCSLFGRRGPQAVAEAQFVAQFSKAPASWSAALETDEHSSKESPEDMHTLGYVWSAGVRPQKFAFFLTTTTSRQTPFQLKATATRIAPE